MKPADDPTSLEEALNRYWRDWSSPEYCHPDYLGFDSWLAPRLEMIKSGTPLPLHAAASSSVLLLWELARTAKAAGIEITRDAAKPHPSLFAKWNGKESKLKRLNKGKLLLACLGKLDPRGREMLVTLLKADVSPDSLARTASQSEHRATFFDAVAKGDQLASFKMIGRLRDEDHDQGEVAFLEATAHFYSNRFAEAIRYASEVQKDAIDWPRAFMLILESHAYVGDFSSIEHEISTHSDFIFPECFALYMCQVAIENSYDPVGTLERAKKLLEDLAFLPQSVPSAFQMWNRHSCQLAVRVLEQLRDASLTKEALQQTASEGEPLEELEESQPFRQMLYALSLDQDLLSSLLQTTNDPCQELVKRLMNYGSPGRDDYFQALNTQWRLGERSGFLANVLAALESLIVDPSAEATQTLTRAYQDALLLNRQSDAELLRRKLSKVPTLADRLSEIERTNSTDRLEIALSPMARIALRSANWDLAQADREALLWKDSGMISLGFFRAIEIEFTVRLIRPMLERIDIDALGRGLAGLKAMNQKPATKATEFWERMLPQLRRAKQNNSTGLELGAIELLLSKIANPTGIDAPLKMPMHAEILRLLNPTGVEALKTGKLKDLADHAAREKFRNPPAHGRYVSLPVAHECKRYVEDVLTRLIEFTTEQSAPTIVH